MSGNNSLLKISLSSRLRGTWCAHVFVEYISSASLQSFLVSINSCGCGERFLHYFSLQPTSIFVSYNNFHNRLVFLFFFFCLLPVVLSSSFSVLSIHTVWLHLKVETKVFFPIQTNSDRRRKMVGLQLVKMLPMTSSTCAWVCLSLCLSCQHLFVCLFLHFAPVF